LIGWRRQQSIVFARDRVAGVRRSTRLITSVLDPSDHRQGIFQ